jgi:hypothetical protein
VSSDLTFSIPVKTDGPVETANIGYSKKCQRQPGTGNNARRIGILFK